MTLNRTENYREEALKQFRMPHNRLCTSVTGALRSVSDNSKTLLFWGHVVQHLLNTWVLSSSKWKTPCFVQWQRLPVFLVRSNNNNSGRDKDIDITQLFTYRRYLVWTGINFLAYCPRHCKHFKDPAVNPSLLFSTAVGSREKQALKLLLTCVRMRAVWNLLYLCSLSSRVTAPRDTWLHWYRAVINCSNKHFQKCAGDAQSLKKAESEKRHKKSQHDDTPLRRPVH